MKKIILFFILMCGNKCFAQSWQDVGGGVTWNNDDRRYYGIEAMANDTIHHYLYVGGAFDSAGHVPTQNLARWDGKKWSGIGNYYDACIFALCMYNGMLAIGDYLGDVTFVDSAGNILNLFSTDGFVNALTTYKNELYVGGDFDEINGVPAVGIARYNGINWESVDSGMQNCCGNGENWALYVWNNKLYAGGFYYQAGDSLANNIASWNDTTWAPLGSGTYYPSFGNAGYVYSLGSYNGNLYVGGIFYSAGGVSSQWLARWNGTNWDSVGRGIYGIPYSFLSFENNLYIAGAIDTAGGEEISGIASWNDTTFSAVDSGFSNGYPFAIDTFNSEIYFGGSFDSAGNIPVNNIARLVFNNTTTSTKQLTINNQQLSLYPNPFSSETILQFSQPPTTNSQLTIFDLTGREVETYFISGGTKNLIIKRNNLPAGMYFYKVACGNAPVITGKIVAE